MNQAHFPDLIRALPDFDGPFDAHRLMADNCEVLFASYPAGTIIETHRHPTTNVGIITEGELILTVGSAETRYGVGDWYYLDANVDHAARFDVSTSEIEFWFAA
jgi:quercetin dioxygenase-like cupin family protein